MISPQEALELVLKKTRPLRTESICLADVNGYCLARDIRADRDLPPTHRSAMDGYALTALNGFHEFVVPAIRHLSGVDAQDCLCSNRLPLAQSATPKGKRLEHILVKVVPTDTGPHLEPIQSHGSADLLAAAQADGVAKLPRERQKCRAGCFVEFSPWRPAP